MTICDPTGNWICLLLMILFFEHLLRMFQGVARVREHLIGLRIKDHEGLALLLQSHLIIIEINHVHR